MPVGEQQEWSDWARQLIDDGRATRMSWAVDPTGETQQALVAAERLALARVLLPQAVLNPELHLPDGLIGAAASEEEAREESFTADRGVGTDDGRPIIPATGHCGTELKPRCWPWSPTASSCAENFPRDRKVDGAPSALVPVHRLTRGGCR
jgi:hypothetical protein